MPVPQRAQALQDSSSPPSVLLCSAGSPLPPLASATRGGGGAVTVGDPSSDCQQLSPAFRPSVRPSFRRRAGCTDGRRRHSVAPLHIIGTSSHHKKTMRPRTVTDGRGRKRTKRTLNNSRFIRGETRQTFHFAPGYRSILSFLHLYAPQSLLVRIPHHKRSN